MNYFKLPDLGEGLQEAEIIEWRVSAGDEVKQDQTLASVETAKAIVDLPSPQDGKILLLHSALAPYWNARSSELVRLLLKP